MRFYTLGLALIISGTVFGENALFNGSFELGMDGYGMQKRLRVDSNPNLEFLPMKIDAGAPGAGKNSLKVENFYHESYTIFSKEFYLEENTRYQLSCRLKSSVPGEKIFFAFVNVGEKWFSRETTFTLTAEWAPYRHILTTEAAGYYHLRFGQSENDGSGRPVLWLDELTLLPVSGKETAILAEAAVAPDKNLYTLGEDQQARITLKIHNPLNAVWESPVRILGVDEYTGEKIFEKNLAASLAPEETKEFVFTEKLKRFISIRLKAAGKNLRSHDGFFVVAGKYTAKPFDIHKDFVLGFNGGFNYSIAPDVKYPSYKVLNAPIEKKFELVAAAGCRLLRSHDSGESGASWAVVEPEKGTFAFSALDYQHSVYQKYQMIHYPVLTSALIRRKDGKQLYWVEPQCKVQEDAPHIMKILQGRILLPPDDAYAAYIRKLAEHMKGKIPVYEISNEPNLYINPENYLRYLKIAYREIHQADPEAKVAGYSLSSDFHAKDMILLDACAKEGGLDYADIVSFHPYGYRTLGAFVPADKHIDSFKAKLAFYGKAEMPLWNSELYYLIDPPRDTGFEESKCKPHHLAWRFLVDLGEGVGQSMMLPENYLFKQLLAPHHPYVMPIELIPSELFPVSNALARFFEAAKVTGKFRYPDGVICYAFQKDGKPVAAAWNYTQTNGLYGDLSRFEVYDLFGNPEKPGKKLFGDAPYYLKPGELSEKEFLTALQNLHFELAMPVSATPFARKVKDRLFATLHNSSSATQHGEIGVNGALIAKGIVSFTLAPHSISVVEIPLKKAEFGKGKVNLVIFGNGTNQFIPIEVVENRSTGKDFQLENGSGTLTFGKDGIQLTLKIKDGTDSGAIGTRSPWESDCVELFFDLNPLLITDKMHPQLYTPETFRLFILPRDNMKLTVLGTAIKAENCVARGKTASDGYELTVDIPVECGRFLGFDIKIDDFEGTHKVSETSFSGGKEMYKKRCNFAVAE